MSKKYHRLGGGISACPECHGRKLSFRGINGLIRLHCECGYHGRYHHHQWQAVEEWNEKPAKEVKS